MRFWLLLVAVLLACTASADELTRTVQEQLQAQGAYSGPLDGKPSAELTKAIENYQQRHNLPASGAIDRATAKALDDESGMALPNVPTTPPAQPAQQISPPPAHTPPLPIAGTPKLSPSQTPTTPATPVATIPRPPPPIPTPTASAGNPPLITQPTPNTSATAAAEAATPPLRSTPVPVASPPSAGELPPQFTVERVTQFLRDYLHAGEGKYVTPQLRYFAFPVDYFDHGQVNQQFVRRDTLRYMRRWPHRRYMLTEAVNVAPIDSKTAAVDFTIAFSVQAGKRRSNGRTYIRATLRESEGKLKIVAIKERRLDD